MKRIIIYSKSLFIITIMFVLLITIGNQNVIAGTPQEASNNLLVNGDAENGNIAGWVDQDGAWTAVENEGGVLPYQGKYFFWPRLKDLVSTTMYQDVDVSPNSTDIDSGLLSFELSGWLSDWDQNPTDHAILKIAALDANGNILTSFQKEHSSPTWTQYIITESITKGTRVLRVSLIANRYCGSDNDGYLTIFH